MTPSDWSFILAPCFFRGKDVVQVWSCFDLCVSLNPGHPKLAHVSIETHGDLGGSMGIPHFKKPPMWFSRSPHISKPPPPLFFSRDPITTQLASQANCGRLDQDSPWERPLIYTENGTYCFHVLPTPHKQCFMSSCERGVYLGNEWNPGAGYLTI